MKLLGGKGHRFMIFFPLNIQFLSFSIQRATTGLFTPVRYCGRSGSQELGHLKSVAFAGAWLFEEFSRASGAYRLFYPCGLLEKPFGPLTGYFTPVCSSKSHLAPNTMVFTTATPCKTPCIEGIWLFKEPTGVKQPVCPACSRKLLKKPRSRKSHQFEVPRYPQVLMSKQKKKT